LLGSRAVVTDNGDGTYTITNPTSGDQIHRVTMYAMSLIILDESIVVRPFEFNDIVFSNSTELIDSMYDFYEGVGGFEISGNLIKNYDDIDGEVIIALYNDSETLVSAKIIENAGEVYEEFVLPEDVEMNQSWQLKAFVWESIYDMKPIQEYIDLNI